MRMYLFLLGWYILNGYIFFLSVEVCLLTVRLFYFIYGVGTVSKKIGHPQTCVYPDVCLGIAHASGKVPLSGQGVW